MFEKVLPAIPRGALIRNDRYFAKPKILATSRRAGGMDDQPRPPHGEGALVWR